MSQKTSGQWDKENILRVLIVITALVAVGLGWLSALQTSIGAAGDPSPDALPGGLVDPLMDDSGEFVVAWNTWGDAHPPGYPLLNFLGNVQVRVYRLLGAAPIVAASLVSFGFGLGALLVLAVIVLHADQGGMSLAAGIVLPAFGGLVWLYAAVAEVYALGLLLGFASLALALETGRHPTRPSVLTLGVVYGLAVGHHRTLLMLAPAMVIVVWPALRLGWRVWIGAAALAVLTLGVYVYLPTAALLGSPWIYGRSPATWPGLMDAIFASEYSAQLAPPTDPAGIAQALAGRVDFLAREITWPGLALGAAGIGLGLAQPQTRRVAAMLGIAAGGYLLAPVGQHLLIGTHLPIMVASLALAAGWGVGVGVMGQWNRAAGFAGLIAAVIVAGLAFRDHQPVVQTYTHDPVGSRIIAAFDSLEDRQPTIVEAWGPRFYALAYGKYATGELANATLIDSRGDLRTLPDPASLPATLYTTEEFLYLAGPEQWAAWWGAPIRLESAGDRIVAISQSLKAAGSSGGSESDPAVVLTDASAWIEGSDLRLIVVWEAVSQTTVDYHVFVQVTDQGSIDSPDDILAQGDRANPVYGFYPTSRWQAGERVRDDYRIPIPGGTGPTAVEVGLYTIDASGQFVNHSRHRIPIEVNK